MRIQVELDDSLIAQLDELAGPRGQSGFVRSAIERAIREERRWADLEAAAGSIQEASHPWDGDTASWVREQRRTDRRQAG